MVEASELTLVSLSCTTGWTDWAHGELWVGPSGALRIDNGLLATVETGGKRQDVPKGQTRTVTDEELADLKWKSKRTIWVRWDEVTSAVVQRNVFTDLVRLRTAGGRVTLWWFKADGALEPVLSQLHSRGIRPRTARFARFIRTG